MITKLFLVMAVFLCTLGTVCIVTGMVAVCYRSSRHDIRHPNERDPYLASLWGIMQFDVFLFIAAAMCGWFATKSLHNGY